MVTRSTFHVFLLFFIYTRALTTRIKQNRKCFTPSSGKDATNPSYPLHYDLKRFVDCELRGKGCAAASDLSAGSLHYFLTGPDKFQSTSGVFFLLLTQSNGVICGSVMIKNYASREDSRFKQRLR